MKYELVIDGHTVKISEKHFHILVQKYTSWMSENGRCSIPEILLKDGKTLMSVPFEAFCVGYIKSAMDFNIVNDLIK